VPGSLCPHADTQPARVALYRELVARGRLPAGWELDEAAAGVFVGGRLVGGLADRPGAAVRAVPAGG
jgi:dipeptidase E